VLQLNTRIPHKLYNLRRNTFAHANAGGDTSDTKSSARDIPDTDMLPPSGALGP